MDPGLLYECPFTDYSPMGAQCVLGKEYTAEVLQILRGVEARVVAK